jgi:hypothetical protein
MACDPANTNMIHTAPSRADPLEDERKNRIRDDAGQG